MSRTTAYEVTVAGKAITGAAREILLSVSVDLRAGDEGDSAQLAFDDRGGQIAMPETGAAISIALGWAGQALRVVFTGTVDEVRSTGGRDQGRLLSISARGFDPKGGAKSGKRRHWDNETVGKILNDAAAGTGVQTVRVDPQLATITLKYWAMTDESFIHMGQRLARRIGGNFRVQGETAIMARRGASYAPSITAAVGSNLHGWDISPVLSREIYGKIVAPFFDRNMSRWDKVEVETGMVSDAVLTIKPPASDKDDAKRQAEAQAEASKRAAGGGSVTIEGEADATPDGLCVVRGARAGIDGSYRIVGVSHSISRDSGFVTRLEIGHPDAVEGAKDDTSVGA